MSAAAVSLVYNAILGDLLALASIVLEDDSISTNTKIGRNTLANSQLKEDLFGSVSQTGGADAVVKALFANYVIYLEWDRPPMYGKRPPISALKDWAAKNNIPTDAGTLHAISYAIWRDGHTGRPIFATMDKALDGLFQDDWAAALRDAITDNLDKIFNY